MFSTPFTSCSIGAATVSATTFALAPGYVAETFTVGGTTSGYCAIGSACSATRPIITMTSDSTVAKTGRSTKKRANIGGSYEAAFGGASAAAGGPGRMLTFCGVTVTPGRTRWMPLTITHSPGASPSATARSPAWSEPSFTGRYSTTLLSFTTRTYF